MLTSLSPAHPSFLTIRSPCGCLPLLPAIALPEEEKAGILESHQSLTPVSPEVTGRCSLLLVTNPQTQTKVVKQSELDERLLFLFGLRSALFPQLGSRKQSTCSTAAMPLARKGMCLCGHAEVPRTKGRVTCWQPPPRYFLMFLVEQIALRCQCPHVWKGGL